MVLAYDNTAVPCILNNGLAQSTELKIQICYYLPSTEYLNIITILICYYVEFYQPPFLFS